MKKFSFLFPVLCLVLVAPPSVNPAPDIPDFVLNPPQQEDALYGTGTAKMANPAPDLPDFVLNPPLQEDALYGIVADIIENEARLYAEFKAMMDALKMIEAPLDKPTTDPEVVKE